MRRTNAQDYRAVLWSRINASAISCMLKIFSYRIRRIEIDERCYLLNILRNIFLYYSRDGVSDQPYLYPFSIIFFPCLHSFICGTLEMALIFIFLSYRYPCLPTFFLCLSLILMRHNKSDRMSIKIKGIFEKTD